MQIFLFITLILSFCVINCKIIISDLKTKKIPNKFLLQLLILLPFWYIFWYFFSVYEINFLYFFWQIFLSFLISFLLFNFWIWRAWDAKYLLILSLFIPHIWIIPFIWNLGLFTIFYLFLFFIWFFIGKSIFHSWHFKNLIKKIKIDLRWKWEIYKERKWWKTFSVILKWLVVFLIIFVSLRLFRIYLFLEFTHIFWQNWQILEFFQKYHFYIIFASIWFFIWLYYIWKKIINFLKNFISQKLKVNTNLIWNIFLTILFFLLIWFIFLEFQKNPNEILNYLIKIFTIYIAFYIFAKIIFYSYKLSFLESEEQTIHVKHLKSWQILEKKYLYDLSRYFDEKYIKGKWVTIPKKYKKFFKKEEYLKYIKGINAINEENIFFLQRKIKEIKKINRLYKTKKDIENLNILKILKTFSFAYFIFIWFCITIFYNNQIILYLINTAKEILLTH